MDWPSNIIAVQGMRWELEPLSTFDFARFSQRNCGTRIRSLLAANHFPITSTTLLGRCVFSHDPSRLLHAGIYVQCTRSTVTGRSSWSSFPSTLVMKERKTCWILMSVYTHKHSNMGRKTCLPSVRKFCVRTRNEWEEFFLSSLS